MKRILLTLITLPFEIFVSLLGYAVFVTLYAQIVAVPLFFILFIGTVLFMTGTIELYFLYGFAAVGTIAGVVWAERIRRSYSIFGFHGYLMGHPEIDGWQRPKEGILFRNGNLTKQSQ